MPDVLLTIISFGRNELQVLVFGVITFILLITLIRVVFIKRPDILVADEGDSLVNDILVGNEEQGNNVILLLGRSAKYLPLDLVIECSLELVKKRHRCLLVDLDLKRKPLEDIFETEISGDEEKSIYSSSIAGIDIFPASIFQRENPKSPFQSIINHKDKYGYVIFYCPIDLPESLVKKICLISGTAYLFFESNKISIKTAKWLKRLGLSESIVVDSPVKAEPMDVCKVIHPMNSQMAPCEL